MIIMINMLSYFNMNNDDLEQLKVMIWIDYDNQNWIGYYVGHCNNYKYHKLNGNMFNLCGPSIIWSGGDKNWVVNGEHHNLNGKALITRTGYREWRVHGELVKCYRFYSN